MGKIIELAPSIDTDEVIARKGAGYRPDFRIYTAGIESDPHNDRLVHMIGSSTVKDLSEDTMTLLALNDMTKAASNMTIWLNHNYDLPDSIFGSVVGTPMIVHQDGIADLHLDVDVELDNPNAARTKRYINNGRKLGCSIGCMITKYEIPTAEDGDGWETMGINILGVYVVEYSVVGIPCNQRSWVENGIRGVFTRTLDPALAPAMKSLWPSKYQEIVKGLPVGEKREELEAIMARPAAKPDARVEWLPAKKTFLFTHGNVKKELSAKDVQAMIRAEEAGTPVSVETYKDADPADVATSDVEPEELDTVKTACGSTSWPLNMDRSWDKGSAHGRLLEWAGGKENFSGGKFKKVHFRYTGSGDKITDFHFPFCDIVDGNPTAIWHAITAAAAALGGARGGANDEGDEGAMRSKIAAYYRKAGKPTPWSDSGDDKGIEDEDIEQKDLDLEEEEMHVFAINKDGSQGIEIQKDGNHAAFSGTHTHAHLAFGGASGDANGQHEHEHSHDNTGSHEQHGHENTVPDGDNDADDQPEAVTTVSASVPETIVTKEAEEEPAEPETPLEPATLALLNAYNTVGKQIGMPEITSKDLRNATHPALTQKDAPQMHPSHIMKCMAIHSLVHEMSNGACCDNGEAMSTAVQQAQEASGQNPNGASSVAYAIADKVDLLMKGVERYNAAAFDMVDLKKEAEVTRKELKAAYDELSQLGVEIRKAQETVGALKNMPLGNPLHHSRTVHPEDNVARREDFLNIEASQKKAAEPRATDNLAAAFALTEIKMVDYGNSQLKYRYWPEGVGGSVEKGVRPALTGNQMAFMEFSEIKAYQRGEAAKVPYIETQVAHK